MKGKPRDSYTLVTKLWFQPKGLPEPERPDADVCVARFLKELDTDYIDIVQIHCQTSAKWPEEMRKQMDLLEDLKQQGDDSRPRRVDPFAGCPGTSSR